MWRIEMLVSIIWVWNPEFILKFHRWIVWLLQNWVIISFRKSSKMTSWVNTIPSWDLSFTILVEAIWKFNIELCCHLQFLWQPNKCPFLELQCKWNECMYSFQNATNKMKAWLPNDSLEVLLGNYRLNVNWMLVRWIIVGVKIFVSVDF
jgi:hypothetical protein